MSPVSKSESGGGGVSKGLHRQSKSHEKQSSMDSPSSKQSYSSRTGGAGGSKGHHHRRRRSSPTAIKSSLRETLSSFGDDVIRVKKFPGQYAYDNHGYFQPDLSFDTGALTSGIKNKDEESPFPHEKESVENELAVIMSHHDTSFQTKHFERVKPGEVGMKPSKWQQLLQAVDSSSGFQKLKRQSKKGRTSGTTENSFLEDFYNDDGKIDNGPPFWGVSGRTRGNFSFLSLSLILHELACFTSCVLLGCMIFQGMEAISWAQQKPLTENWLLFKCYSSFQTVLVVVTCVGFLNRMDTTDLRSLWLLPLFLAPVLGLSISDYCNKAWELQRLECFDYYRLGAEAKQKVHLSQGCPSMESLESSINSKNLVQPFTFVDLKRIMDSTLTELNTRGVGQLVMRIIAMLSILVISVYLFCCRKYNFLIDLFGPPEDFVGNLELVLPDGNDNRKSKPDNGGGKDNDEEIKVIYKRNDSSRE